VDSSVIFGVVFIKSIVGFLKKSKAEKAIEALAPMVVTQNAVRRDCQKQRISSEELVPGDVVLLQAGDRVPADVRLFHLRGLQVDESALTGESVPVHKHSDALALETVLADRKKLAFAGTFIVSGPAESVFWAIGHQTEEGTTSTPYDIVMPNDLDRFHLVADVIDRVPALGPRGGLHQASHLRQAHRSQAIHRGTGPRPPGNSPLEVAST
jgi:magnesium-transporting ATPase (P-type)